MLLRRLLLAAVLVLVRSTSVWVWLSLCNSFILAAHARLLPYARRRDNEAELLTLSSLTLQTMTLAAFPPPVHSTGVLALLLTFLILPLLAIAVLAVSGRWQRRKEEHRPSAAFPSAQLWRSESG